jgi:Fe-S cluster biosynthesis and repair protein YggX
MSDVNLRIEQFRKMAHDDPDNELGHFSLGRAYFDAGMFDGAIQAFQRVLQINPRMSRAYQLLASSLLKKGLREQAIEQLNKGVRIAHERGDLMPRNEMARTLAELGAPAPETETSGAQQVVGDGQVLCARCHRLGARLAQPPFRNDQGRQIQEKVCQPCWREWVAVGTKVINELRLPLADPQAQKVYEQHMLEFLNL